MKKELMLRTCNSNMTSYKGFKWPKTGRVEAEDWNPEPVCEGGICGLLRGEGDSWLLDWTPEAVWCVVEIDANTIVDLEGQIKVPWGEVIYSGDRKNATNIIRSRYPEALVVGSIVSAGNNEIATAGDYGTVTTGDDGIAITRYKGTATAGDFGTATTGNEGTATAGAYGTATVGDFGTATVGDFGTATAEYGGVAIAGDNGTATAGDGGDAIAGYKGTATVGNDGNAAAGRMGIIQIKWWDFPAKRYRIAIGYVGEDDLEAGILYRCKNGKFKMAS